MKNYPEKVIRNIIKGKTPTKASDLIGYNKKGLDYDSITEIMTGDHYKGKKEKWQ